MRILQDDVALVLADRPFAGSLGAALYLGRGAATAIEYRRCRILDGATSLVPRLEMYPLGEASVPKTPAVDLVKSPTTELQATIPADWLPGDVWANVRTHQADIENETIYHPRRLKADGTGDVVDAVLGTARVLGLDKRDAGGLRLRWVYAASRDGLQPDYFLLRRTAGPTAVASVTTSAIDGGRDYAFELAGLQDGGAYTFAIDAVAGTITTTLLTGIAFTADAAGPPAVSGLVAEEY
ncbi:MAG TPA: hypothetical protein VL132_13715 [Planctomycetaceae bacterium]|nr:hypothetical protein [Planctomycetaceae bacterium]